ncbi:MAG: hypothetical protein ACR2H1_06550 [Limisphaerales bacterium]
MRRERPLVAATPGGKAMAAKEQEVMFLKGARFKLISKGEHQTEYYSTSGKKKISIPHIVVEQI